MSGKKTGKNECNEYSKARRGLFGRVAASFSEAFPDAPGRSRCELSSDRRLLVGGCKKILTYRSELVRLSLCDMILAIDGEGLCIRGFFCEEAEVCGRIAALRIERREGRGERA